MTSAPAHVLRLPGSEILLERRKNSFYLKIWGWPKN